MSIFNFATKEMTLKVVYYGPGLCGKTTNLQYLHSILNPQSTGKLLSLATETDRTLFFDFLPVALGKIKGFSVKIQLYTVPGQVYYNATRKLVLKGADAVIFVANSQKASKEENIESLKNMWENLIANNINPNEIPILIQYNKRDLPEIDTTDELNSYLNTKEYAHTEAVAIKGEGVEETFQLITKLLIKCISKKHKIETDSCDAIGKNILCGLKKEDTTVKSLQTSNMQEPFKASPQSITVPKPEVCSLSKSAPPSLDLPIPESKLNENQGQTELSSQNSKKLVVKLNEFTKRLSDVNNNFERIFHQLQESKNEHREMQNMIKEVTHLLNNGS